VAPLIRIKYEGNLCKDVLDVARGYPGLEFNNRLNRVHRLEPFIEEIMAKIAGLRQRCAERGGAPNDIPLH
jgi:hypothetical protein